jgi:hypothetical protein
MGRRLLEQRTKIDAERRYSPREAIELIKSLEGAKFDESVEAHVHLSVDPRRADQMVRGTLMLPNGTGKTRRVAVFAEGEKAREAEEAAPTWSAPTIWPPASRTRASWTSTWRSPRRPDARGRAARAGARAAGAHA